MRISGSDILLDIYPGWQEPVDATSGALVPVGSRDVAQARTSQTTPESGRESRDVSTSNTSDAARQRRQDTVEIQQVKVRDTVVLQSGQAHLGADGTYARGVPQHDHRLEARDRLYIAGGEVSLDVIPVVNSPLNTLARMGQIRQAARTPNNHPVQDYLVASHTHYEIYRTRMEILNQRREKTQENPQFITQQKGTMIDAWA
jgi:hypothetical protein